MEFYVKYSEEWTEDLFKALWNYLDKLYPNREERDSPSCYTNTRCDFKLFKEVKYFWTGTGYYFSIDNNTQGIKTEYSIQQVKDLINYKKPNTDIVVHCKSQQEWDFAAKKLNRKDTVQYLEQGDNCCIYLKNPDASCRLEFAKKYCTILSFEDWCKENNYTPDWLEKTEFKKGDYVVYLNKNDDGEWLKYNYCYIHDGKCKDKFSTSKDSKNEHTWSGGTSYNSNLWRYASKEEIAEYDRIQKPFDVTILNSKSKEDELLEEAKKRYPVGTKFKSPYKSCGDLATVRTTNFYWWENTDIVVDSHSGFSVYSNGKWAEIVEDKPQFIKEKWYKIFNVWYAKFECLNSSGKRWKFSENISADKKYCALPGSIDIISTIELLTDLSEIQQYLPEGHSDKISTNDTLKVGEIYYVDDKSGFWMIGEAITEGVKEIDGYYRSKATFISSNSFLYKNKWSYKSANNNNRTFRLATSEEKQWLQACIKADKFISKEEALQKETNEEKTMTSEELLAEAKRRYPIGTKCICLTTHATETIISELEWYCGNKIIQIDEPRTRVYRDGKWAEIVEEPSKPQFIKGEWYICSCNENLYRFNGFLEKDKFGYNAIINPTDREINFIKPGYTAKVFNKALVEYFDPAKLADKSIIEKFLPKLPSQFEVGKWYKNLGITNSIAKLHHISDNKFWHTDHISSGKNFQKGCGNAYYRINLNTELIDLSEIQQYLPEGHPDKISNTMNNNNLKWEKGSYVKYKGTKSTGGDWDEYFGSYGVKSGDVAIINSYYGRHYIFVKDNIRDTISGRLAQDDLELITKEEYERVLNSKKTPVEPDIPEYVECISSSDSPKNWTIGKIYKTTPTGIISDNGYDYKKNSYSDFINYMANWNVKFVESTKEAYEAQFNKSEEEWIPKVGDWVVVTKQFVNNSVDIGTIGQIERIDFTDADAKYLLHNNPKFKDGSSWCSEVRKAEPHEIPISNVSNVVKPKAWIKEVSIDFKHPLSYGNLAEGYTPIPKTEYYNVDTSIY